MIVDPGALQAFSRCEEMLFRQRLTAELFVVRGARLTRHCTSRRTRK